jgi:hypothetical protein
VAERLTAELVFARLDELRELLRLTDHLAGFRRASDPPTLERTTRDGHDVVVLYRPTGPAEMRLLEANAMRRWPPRLSEQPIFYPVTNETYAREIAEQWNVAADGEAFITRFFVKSAVASRHAVQTVGARHHTELWVPSEALDELNDAIVGSIEVIARLPSR